MFGSSENQLVIINTMFQQKDRFKATWRHPRPKHWHLLDYDLTRQRDTRDYTDYRLVRCEIACTFKSPSKRKGLQKKKLQVHKRCDPRVKNNLQVQVMLKERLHRVTAAEPKEQCKQMKTILQETTAEVVGLSTRKHQDWFDEADKEIQELLEKKRYMPQSSACKT